MIKLTKHGENAIKNFINSLENKRKEILDSGNDTANETAIPTIEDIISDIECFEEDGEYFNNWGATDHHNNDYLLCLEENIDYVISR